MSRDQTKVDTLIELAEAAEVFRVRMARALPISTSMAIARPGQFGPRDSAAG
jgi:hypothetical protein